MYILQKDEFGIFKPVEISIRMGLQWKGEKIEEMNQF
jgi:hypothetical protein